MKRIEVTGKRRVGFTLLELLVVVAIVAVLIGLLSPTSRRAPEAAKRMSCTNNFRQIALALNNYESEYKSFPPAYTVDSEGKRLHSWRTLILPYLEQTQLYQSIDLNKPWDDPVNANARATAVPSYCCPSFVRPTQVNANDAASDQYTVYLGLVGESLALRSDKRRRLKEFTDGVASTMLVVEANVDQAVPWMSPFDMDEAMLVKLVGNDANTVHRSGRNCVMADASVTFLSVNVAMDKLRALATLNAGDVVLE
jgi:prepilin-type N-terminal cleavage/methylation domain-containing protein